MRAETEGQRQRQCNWIAQDAESNGRVNIARDVTPFLKVGEGVALGGFVIHAARSSSFALPLINTLL